MKAESITFQTGTQYTCFVALKFSQQQKFYPYPKKNQEKDNFWAKNPNNLLFQVIL